MMNRLYYIDNTSLATMARPRGGDWLMDDLMSLKMRKVATLVCLMDKDEMYELDLQEEANTCREIGMEFIHFPVPDFGLPSNEPAAKKLVSQLGELVENGKKVAVHCRMGIGRSSMIAAATLVTIGKHTSESAFEAITEARGLRVPDTQQQIDWVRRFEERLKEGK